MEQVNAFLEVLRPETLGDILVYLVFFTALIATFALADGNNKASYLLYGTIILALFNLTVAAQWSSDTSGIYSRALIVYATQIGMVILPFIAAGAARVKKKKGGAAMPISLVAGVIAVVYVAGIFLVPTTVNAPLF